MCNRNHGNLIEANKILFENCQVLFVGTEEKGFTNSCQSGSASAANCLKLL